MSARKLAVVQLLPELQSGGVERGTLEIGRALCAAGHRSVVVSGGGRLVSRLQDEGSEHIHLAVGKKTPRTLLLVRPLRQLLQRMQPDILHLRSRLPAWIGYLAWRGLPADRRPHLVTTVHGLYSVGRYSGIMTRGEAVIAVSQTVSDYIRSNYPQVPPERITVIHRGVDEEEFRPAPERAGELRAQLQCPPSRKLMLFPGRISRRKGLETAIELLRQLVAEKVDVQLVVAGDVHRSKRHFWLQVQRTAARVGVSDRLSFLGHCSDMRHLYAACDLVLHLGTRPEAFGRVGAEALAMGTPLVAWDVGGIGEILRQAFPQGAVAQGNIKLLRERVREVLQSDSAGERIQSDCFPLWRMQEATLQLYQHLVARRSIEDG